MHQVGGNTLRSIHSFLLASLQLNSTKPNQTNDSGPRMMGPPAHLAASTDEPPAPQRNAASCVVMLVERPTMVLLISWLNIRAHRNVFQLQPHRRQCVRIIYIYIYIYIIRELVPRFYILLCQTRNTTRSAPCISSVVAAPPPVAAAASPPPVTGSIHRS
jgi:hypothetical protein